MRTSTTNNISWHIFINLIMGVKPLPTQRKVLTWLYIYYSDKDESKSKKNHTIFLLCNCYRIIYKLYNGQFDVLYEIHLNRFRRIIVRSLPNCCSIGYSVHVFYCIPLNLCQITGIFNELSTIYKASKIIYCNIFMCTDQIKFTENSNCSENRVL